MFDAVTAIVFGLIGLAIGAGAMWALARMLGAEAAARREGLSVRLEERERSLGEAQAELTRREEAIRDLQSRANDLAAQLHKLEAAADRLARTEAELAEIRALAETRAEKISSLTSEIEAERKALAEQKALLAEAQTKLQDAFKALAADALSRNNQAFLELARTNLEKEREAAKGEAEKGKQAVGELVAPLAKQLERYETQIQEMEKARQKAYGELLQQVATLGQTQRDLGQETRNLVAALSKPQVRGRWGEVTLRRVVELAGLVDHCDFNEQTSVETEAGMLRPDMTVNLPGGRTIVIDAKTPLAAYLDALEAPGEESRSRELERHARHVADHMKKLSAKQYWSQFKDHTPDFVVMFIPAENFLNAALDKQPGLIESGFQQNVILSSPSTLIALLKAVALGWRQEQLAESARRVSELGTELYERLATMSEHINKLGSSLTGSVDHYNRAVASLETRVLVTARKFPDLGISIKKEMAELTQVERTPRRLESPEMAPADEVFENDKKKDEPAISE